ncbi:MAG TPA: endonuclease/exonuclease/phosphatase family protein [Candidatus Acidoferrum sp.]|nr:endonuclease/exonuclease/phosphatase family protein [Candidatus Acidoferrum sp.]
MKRVAPGFAAFLISAPLAGAALLLSDSFNYPDGPLVTVSSNVWVHHSPSGSNTGEVMVASGQVLLSEANFEDVHALFTASASETNAVYASFTVRFTALPGGGGAYFAHFKNAASAYRARIWALTGGAALDRFRLGISSTSGSAISATNPTDLRLNTDYLVVTRLVASNSVSTLWINPQSENDPAVSSSESSSTFTAAGYAFREADGEGALNLDNLRVGTAFADVVTGGAQPPAIISQSPNQTVTNGAGVTFGVTATGTPPLGFQWRFTPASGATAQGTNLPGATGSNLTLTAAMFAQAGYYAVLVTNAAGSALSDPVVLNVWAGLAPAFSYLTYNVHGNGLTNWSTNMWHVQAIGRQMRYLDPDIITFNEIPVTNNCTAQMADFVAVFRPGYFLATNSTDDGYIRSVILSRYPITASRSWLHGDYLGPFGYTNADPAPYFTRDVFEAEIAVPGFSRPVHMFTAHLKSAQDAASAAKRAAEAGAVSNFFATIYLPAKGQEPYVLSGDLNEDLVRQPASNPQSVQRLISAPTGLHLATPVNPITATERTWSIQDADGPTARYDYILPCASLFSNIVGGQVFRTDLLQPVPPGLYSNDDKIASDHLPVFLVFANPYNTPFRLLSLGVTNQFVSLTWETTSNRQYHVEISSNLATWASLATNLTATGDDLTFATNVPGTLKFFRVRRAP